MAIIYPVGAFLLTYIVSGNNLIGDMEFLPPRTNGVLRTGIVGVIIAYSLTAYFLFSRIDKFSDYLINKIIHIRKYSLDIIVLVGVYALVVVGVVGGGCWLYEDSIFFTPCQ